MVECKNSIACDEGVQCVSAWLGSCWLQEITFFSNFCFLQPIVNEVDVIFNYTFSLRSVGYNFSGCGEQTRRERS